MSKKSFDKLLVPAEACGINHVKNCGALLHKGAIGIRLSRQPNMVVKRDFKSITNYPTPFECHRIPFINYFSIPGIVAFWLPRENVTPRKYLAMRALETKSWDLGQEAIMQYA